MGRLRGRRLGAGLFLIAVAIGMFWLSRFLISKGLDWIAKASEVASFVLAALGVVVAPIGRVTRWARGPQPPTPEEIDRARINLHAALSGAWSEEGSEVYEDLPMRVRFAPWTEDVSPQVFHEDASIDGPPRERSRAGDFDSVADAFSQVPRYRRVVLGEAGAGKTVLVAELQRRLVEAPRQGDPLPVIVPAAAWRPDRQSLLDWLAQQLATDYGWLPVAHARALVARGIVLPVLDGLDEMPSSLRPDAIARINKYHVYRPLIVTSREGEYRDAIRKTRVGVKGSVVVNVQPLRPEDTRAYLGAAGEFEWAKVLGEMNSDDEALARVLSNPLMLWLARVEYEGKSPGNLTLFGSRRALENFLLNQFVPSVYAEGSNQAVAGQFRCTAEQAKRWLGHLAWDIYQQYRSNQQVYEDRQEAKDEGRRTDTGGAPVLGWWEISDLAGRLRRLGIALRTGVLCSVVLTLTIWVLKQHGNWRHGAYSGPINFVDLFLGGPVGRLTQPTVHVIAKALQEAGGDQVKPIGKVFSIIFSHLFLMILAAVLFVIIVAALRSLDAYSDPVRLRIRPVAFLAVPAWCCFLFGLATAAATLFLFLGHWPVSASVFFSSRSTWITLLSVSLLGLISLPGWFTGRSDAYGNLNPEESLRLDRQADAVVTISERCVFAVAVWLICGRSIAVAYAVYAITATVVELALGGQQSFASRSYVDARNWLAPQGRIPWRTMAFLSDASRRGVLRQVGAAYQFRHIRLLEQVGHWRSANHGDWLNRWRRHREELVDEDPELIEGRSEETLDAISQDAKLYQQKAQASLDVRPPGLAQALDGLADRLQRWPDARARPALRDVLDTYRTLAETDPATFKPGLARALKASASAFRWDEGLHVSIAAVDCYRELAQTDPAAFQPALVEAVRDLTDRLSWLGRVEEALALTREIVDNTRNLAEIDPPAFLPILANSLSDLGDWLWKFTSLREESVSVRKEAAAIYRELAEVDSARFGHRLTSSLDVLVSSFKTLHRQKDEQAAIHAALDAYRERGERIAEIRHQMAESDLAIVFQNSQGPATAKRRFAQTRFHRNNNALAVARTAAATYGNLAESQPTEFLPDLADAVQGLAVELRSAGKWREARILADAAYRIRLRYRRSLDFAHRRVQEVEPLDRIDNLALLLWKLGEHQNAVAAGQVSRDLAPASHVDAASAIRRRPSAGRLFIRLLLTYLWEERKLWQVQKWVRFTRNSVSELLPQARKDPEVQSSLIQAQQHYVAALEDQSEALDTLVFQRSVSNRSRAARIATRRALKAQREAVAMYREIYDELSSSDRYNSTTSLANSLDTLALRLRVAGDLEAAKNAVCEASKLRQTQQEAPSHGTAAQDDFVRSFEGPDISTTD